MLAWWGRGWVDVAVGFLGRLLFLVSGRRCSISLCSCVLTIRAQTLAAFRLVRFSRARTVCRLVLFLSRRAVKVRWTMRGAIWLGVKLAVVVRFVSTLRNVRWATRLVVFVVGNS